MRQSIGIRTNLSICVVFFKFHYDQVSLVYVYRMFEEHPSENCWRASSDVWAPSCWARCCSPKPAITLATTEHHRPFVPSLVPNHPRTLRISPIKAELQDMSDLPQSKFLVRVFFSYRLGILTLLGEYCQCCSIGDCIIE